MTRSRLAAAFALALMPLVVLGGCTNAPAYGINSDPPAPATDAAPANPRITYNQVASGEFIQHLPDGSYLITYPGKDVGTPNDLKCLAITETAGSGKYAVGYGGLSCDWQGAWNVRAAPAP